MKRTALLLLWSHGPLPVPFFARRTTSKASEVARRRISSRLCAFNISQLVRSLSMAGGRWRGRTQRDNRPLFPQFVSRLDIASPRTGQIRDGGDGQLAVSPGSYLQVAGCSSELNILVLVAGCAASLFLECLMKGCIVCVEELLIEVELGNRTERHSDAVCRSFWMYPRHRLQAQSRDAVKVCARAQCCSTNTAEAQPPYALPLALCCSTRPFFPSL